MNLPLVTKKAEARVDSRLLAQHLGNQHKNTYELIKAHQPDFERLGKVPFETEALTSGQSQRYALLNEDQAYLLLTYSRNTKRTRELKVKLVLAFREARRAAELHAEYLPTYHGLHDQLHALARQA